MKLIIDIPEDELTEEEIEECIRLANIDFSYVLSTKDMTNGEVVKTIFPNVTIEHKKGAYDAGVIMYDIKWWNAPYKGGDAE